MPDDSSIEELRKKLYARAGGPKPKERRKLREDAFDVAQTWQPDAEEVAQQEQVAPMPSVVYERKQAGRTVRTIFIISGIFFLASSAVAAWLFFSGKSVISNDNIDMQISGPVSVPGGEELNLQVEIVNRNPVPLILADLIVEYPEGTKSPSNVGTDMPRTRETIGTIAPGASVKKTIRGVLFGVEGTQKKVAISLEYQIEDSNALFKKDHDYNVLLSSAPVAIKVDALKEITPGQEITLTAHIISNSSKVLSNMLVSVDYPFGFVPTVTDPKPAYNANVWNLGDLTPGSERVITIKGTLAGQNTEERVFRFQAGSANEKKPDTIAAMFQSTEVPVILKRPFVNLAFEFDGQDSKGVLITSRGKRLSGNLHWTNTLPSQISDLEIDLVLAGSTLDQKAIGVGKGFYRSIDNTIIWSSETNRELALVEPGEDGIVSFTFGSTPFKLGSNIRSPVINLTAHIKGRRLGETGVPETLESSANATVKLAAEPSIASRVLYYSGPFQNTGPVPPRVNSETTYTVTMSVANDINDLRNVTVVSKLPSYVKWQGVVSPQNADITYNAAKGQLVWNIGSLPAGTGYNTEPVQIAFQVSIVPSLSQVNNAPTLLEEQHMTGIDQFTGNMIETSHRNLTTDLPTDPNASPGAGSVTP
jgi:hypothetical protein